MQERFEIENLEQLRTISDELRLRIIALLQEQPMTVKQVSDSLEMTPSRVHYHVRELEKVGLLLIVETREKGGILEKYYQPVAHEIVVSRTLLLSFPPDQVVSTVDFWFDRIKGNFVSSLSQKIQQEDDKACASFGVSQLYLTEQERESLSKTIDALLVPYKEPRHLADEQLILSTQIMSSLHVPLFASPVPEPSLPFPETATPATLPTDLSSPPLLGKKSINVWVMGVKDFIRQDLEDALNGDCHLHVSIIGMCRFSEDIPAQLVRRTVKHFSLIGKLVASKEVREVLLSK